MSRLLLSFFVGATALCLVACSPSVRLSYRPQLDSVQVLHATASNAMVVSAHPFASETGVRILRTGGNAADAAVATVAALNVVEPHASGLGGGGFVLYYDAKRDSVVVIDYRERAPGNITRRQYYESGDTAQRVRQHGATAIGTPGAPAGWQSLHDHFGTRPLAELLAPAVAAADTGFRLSEKQCAIIVDHLPDILPDSAITATFLADGFPPAAGFRVKQPALSSTLRQLSATSLTRLYSPPFADDIVNAVQARGGSLSREDLASYHVQIRAPLRGWYRGYEILTLPPPSIGGTALLEILKFAERFEVHKLPYLSAEYVHRLAQASRQALKDVTTWISDPEYDEQPVPHLLSDSWISAAFERMDQAGVPDTIQPWDAHRAYKPGNTTHLVVIDNAGNIVSLTQSINDFYGAGVMAPNSGILLNNHMADFSGDSTRKNSVTPFHRPVSNMAATIVRKDGKPVLVIGSPGGPRIAPTVAQVLIAVLDGKASLDDAIKAPRFFPLNSTLSVETRLPQPTIDQLQKLGWTIQLNGDLNNYFGGVHAVQIDPTTHRLLGAADPRRDGAPVGY
ncbi:MAG: Gamma-glutamyltransferase [Bacteroidetes bacterium]|nr:Gamma-glutamyltransferase [Bacteroidota bacterium]